MVKSVWERLVVARSPIERWNSKIRSVQKHLGGWARHTTRIYKKEKVRLSAIIDNLKEIAEVRPLFPHEILLKNQSNAEIARLLSEEEIKWYHRSKSQFILEGDANSRYFHSVANGRHRKKLIHSLVQDEGTIEGHENLKSYITNYYKGLFGSLDEGNFSMDQSRTDDIPQVSIEENNFLNALYTEDEVKKAISKWNTTKPRVQMSF
jgi:mannosylglycoprotein endo-beta-mannosidase